MMYASHTDWIVRSPSRRWLPQRAAGVVYLCHTSTCKWEERLLITTDKGFTHYRMCYIMGCSSFRP